MGDLGAQSIAEALLVVTFGSPGVELLQQRQLKMSLMERYNQWQCVQRVLGEKPTSLDFRWYDQLHSLFMLNCIGNGDHAVTLMKLGSYVNHGGLLASNAEVVTQGSAGHNVIGFKAKQHIKSGEEHLLFLTPSAIQLYPLQP